MRLTARKSRTASPTPCPGCPPFRKQFAAAPSRKAISRIYSLGLKWTGAKCGCKNWDELEKYCYHVAAVVGLIMVHVLTEPAPELLKPARDLGTAMQLTNILRDIQEDWLRDRLYLPLDELEKFGLTTEDIAGQRMGDSFRAMMRFQIGRARAYYSYAEASASRNCPTTVPVFARD